MSDHRHRISLGDALVMVRRAREATLVFMAADDQGADMYQGVLAEYTWPCPPSCDEESPFLRPE